MWFFLRAPLDHGEFANRVLLAPPETTDYLFPNEADYEIAVEQSGQLQDGFLQFSGDFPEVTFAHIVAECFGGVCLYSGYCCRGGKTEFAVARAEKDGHVKLLPHVGIESTGHFVPFTRGFFSK